MTETTYRCRFCAFETGGTSAREKEELLEHLTYAHPEAIVEACAERAAPAQFFQRNDTRGSFLVIGEGETRGEVQLSGRWIASDAPAELLP